jgi:TonB family protein
VSTATYKFLRPGPGEQLGWALALSAGLHILLAGGILVGKLVMPSKREFFSPVYQVQLVGASALLPAAAPPAPPAPPAPKPEAKPEPKPAPKPEAKPKPEPKPETPKEAIALKKPDKPEEKPKPVEKPAEKPAEVDASKELAKRMEALQARSEQRRLEQALQNLQSNVASRGNTVAGAFAGAAGGAQTSMRDQIYLNELWQAIQRNWVLSEVLVSRPRGLVAVVMVRIRKDGNLDKAWLEQGSGNPRYDESALRAAEKAAPFPPPPASGSGAYEVGVRFRVEDAG